MEVNAKSKFVSIENETTIFQNQENLLRMVFISISERQFRVRIFLDVLPKIQSED